MSAVTTPWGRRAFGRSPWLRRPAPVQQNPATSVLLVGAPRERALAGTQAERALAGAPRERTLIGGEPR